MQVACNGAQSGPELATCELQVRCPANSATVSPQESPLLRKFPSKNLVFLQKSVLMRPTIEFTCLHHIKFNFCNKLKIPI